MAEPFLRRRGAFSISTDPQRLDLDVVHGYLTRHSYWAEGIPRSIVERSVKGSLCFGIYDGAAQVGFARVISDQATYAYVCDVFVLESHRGQGLAVWLMECIMEHPDLQGLRRWALTTRDAHGLYGRVGFTPLVLPERWMEITRRGIYAAGGGGGS
jgi:GNAT superfamily N-acetyltransferase